jgi:hypothetical protein
MVLGAFEKESDDSNYFLSRKIFDAFRTPDLISIQQFQSILRKNKQSLLSPLSYKVCLNYFNERNQIPRIEGKLKHQT